MPGSPPCWLLPCAFYLVPFAFCLAPCALPLFLSRHHVRPQRLDVLHLEQVAPGRHLVLALRHGSHEPDFLVGGKLAQISRRLRIHHARAVAGRAVLRVDGGTSLHLLFGECFGVLRKHRKGERRRSSARRPCNRGPFAHSAVTGRKERKSTPSRPAEGPAAGRGARNSTRPVPTEP